MSAPRKPRLSLRALLVADGTVSWTDDQLAERYGTSQRQVQRWHTVGLSPEQAEAVCERLRFHPGSVWMRSWWRLVADDGSLARSAVG